MKTILTTDEALTNILARILAHVSDFFKNPSHNCKNLFILLNNIHHEKLHMHMHLLALLQGVAVQRGTKRARDRLREEVVYRDSPTKEATKVTYGLAAASSICREATNTLVLVDRPTLRHQWKAWSWKRAQRGTKIRAF